MLLHKMGRVRKVRDRDGAIASTRGACVPPENHESPASFFGFFSGAFVCAGKELFAGSFGVVDLSPPAEVAGASFLAACL
jgi:hypothetical protein